MIYTHTSNLAIDLFIETDELKPNFVNRTNYFECLANGKGVNVSLVLKMLGIDSVVTGFKAGFTGAYIEKYLVDSGFKTFMPEVEGVNRINVFTKVINEGNEYKQVNPGPEISENARNGLLDYFENILKKDDVVCLNGSFSEGIDKVYIEKICEISGKSGAKLVLDNSSKFIPELGKYKPYLVKPNETELCDWFGEEVGDENQFIKLSLELINKGFKNVLLSLGEDGAMLINQEEIISVNAPSGTVVNTAMSGDTLLATFLAEKINGKSDKLALTKSVAAGSSTAFTEGLTDFRDVEELMKEIRIDCRR